MSDEKLRFGIVTERWPLRAWEHRCVEEISGEGHEIRLIVEVAPPPEPRPDLFSFFSKRLRSAWLEPAPESALMAQLPRLRSSLSAENALICLNQEEIEALQAHRIDFLLSFVDWKLSPELVSSIPYGAWYFWGIQHSRRRPAAAFWSIYHRSPSTVISLAKLATPTRATAARAGSPESWRIMRQGTIKSETYQATLERGLEIAVQWPAAVCRELTASNPTFPTASQPGKDQDTERPSNFQMLLYSARSLQARVREKTGFFYFTKWSLTVSNEPIEQVISADEPVRVSPLLVPATPFECSADPFVLRRDGALHLFYEEYDCRTMQGHVAYATIRDGEIAAQGRAIEEQHHLSYPCLVEQGGQIYCLPESSEVSKLTLYRAVKFPEVWEQCATLLEERVRDATLFFKNGRWWLFCSGGRLDDNLLIYHADNVFGPWAPHVKNPVKIDIHSARPAGPLLELDGALYRPGQDCAPAYGRRVALNRVDDLSTETYSEQTVRFIAPSSKSPFPDGLHTLCPAGDLTIMDGRKDELLSLPQLLSRVAKRLRRP